MTEIENIRNSIKSHGLELEIFTTMQLRKHGWEVSNQFSYFDPETGTYRTTDIAASKGIGLEPLTQVKIMIECKRSNQPWVFFTSNTREPIQIVDEMDEKIEEGLQKLGILAVAGHKDLLMGDFSKDTEVTSYLQRLYRNNWQWGVIAYEPFRTNGKDLIMDASMQVVKALLYEKKIYEETIEATKNMSFSYREIIVPMIVFDGHLYSYAFKNEKEIIQRADSLLYRFSYRDPYLIQIVTKDGMTQFLEYFDKNLKFLSGPKPTSA